MQDFLGHEVTGILKLSFLVGIGWFGAELLFLWMLQVFMASLRVTNAEVLKLPSWLPQSMEWGLIGFVTFALVRSFLTGARTYLSVATSETFVRHYRTKLIRYSFSHPESISTHQIVDTFTDRIAQCGNYLQHLSTAAVLGSTTLLMIIFGLNFAAKELSLSLLLLLLAIPVIRSTDQMITRSSHAHIQEWSKITRTLIQGLRNSFLLRLYNHSEKEISRAESSLRSYEGHAKHYYRIYAFRHALPLFIGSLIIATVCYLSTHYFGSSTGALLGYVYLFIRIAQAASELSAAVSETRRNLPGFRRLYDWHLRSIASLMMIQDRQEVVEGRKLTSTEVLRLEAKSLGFKYNDSAQPIFSGLNFSIQTGETMWLRGPSGSGKSTLLKIICGLLEPSEGVIQLNGKTPRELRKSIALFTGYVGPDNYLIPGTVTENLSYLNEDPAALTEGDYASAIRLSELDLVLNTLPQGNQTQLLEDAQLSTGQRQRLAIARAILRNPKILILDEATANLDLKTEAKLLENLRPWLKERICILISHRSSVADYCDHTIDLGNKIQPSSD